MLPFESQKFDLEEDWPIDKWGQRDATAVACEALFELDAQETVAVLDGDTAGEFSGNYRDDMTQQANDAGEAVLEFWFGVLDANGDVEVK